MNYTENYHLPQWVKDDRIMMEDFNQMCENIENGLTGNAQTAESFRQNGDAQDRLLMRRLLRLSYNHYLALQTVEPFPAQVGMFYQNPLVDSTGASGGSPWENAYFTGTGVGGYGPTEFFSQCILPNQTKMQTYRYSPENTTPLSAAICAPSATKLEGLSVTGTFSNNIPNAPAPFLLTLNNLDSGEIEQSLPLDLTQKAVSGGLSISDLPIKLYFHAGGHYLLKVEPVGDPVFDGTLEFTKTINCKVQGAGGNGASIIASRVLREREGSSMGLLILRCKAGGPTGQLTVKWDGKTLTPDYVRPCLNDQNLDLREMIYVRRDPIPAETSFSFRFDCGENGSCWFQDWGAILL